MAKNLIAYFTWSGNSAHLAQLVQGAVGGDLFHIRPQQPYPESYPMTASRAYKELQQHLWPALAEQVSEPEQYEQLYLIYPNWCGTMPTAVSTFLTETPFRNVTIHPLCTSGGSGLSDTVKEIKGLEPNATVTDGLHIGSGASSNPDDAVSEWLSEIGLAK